MPERIEIQEGLTLFRLNLQEAREQSPIKEKRFLEKKFLKNLIYHLFGTHTEINHNQYGKPILVGHTGNISVSHNSRWLLVLYSEQSEVGVDVEEIQDRILNIQSKFLSDGEIPEYRNDKRALTIAWCAKEAVLKCIGFKTISFQKHLKIKNFDISEKKLTIESVWPENRGLFNVGWIEEQNQIITYATVQN